jgi:hypothetical protein
LPAPARRAPVWALPAMWITDFDVCAGGFGLAERASECCRLCHHPPGAPHPERVMPSCGLSPGGLQPALSTRLSCCRPRTAFQLPDALASRQPTTGGGRARACTCARVRAWRSSPDARLHLVHCCVRAARGDGALATARIALAIARIDPPTEFKTSTRQGSSARRQHHAQRHPARLVVGARSACATPRGCAGAHCCCPLPGP